jgi:hypothetical protein
MRPDHVRIEIYTQSRLVLDDEAAIFKEWPLVRDHFKCPWIASTRQFMDAKIAHRGSGMRRGDCPHIAGRIVSGGPDPIEIGKVRYALALE